MHDLMIDLETLDTKTSAVVVSIGAVFFDRHSKEIGAKFYIELTSTLSSQIAAGRTVSGDTISWWMRQNDKAREVFNGSRSEGLSVPAELALFREFIYANARNDRVSGDPLVAEVWGNGAMFDNAILRSLCESFNFPVPWRYTADRCYRTIAALFKNRIPLIRQGTHHNALDDAITQAIYLQEIFACPDPLSSVLLAGLEAAKTPLPAS